MRSHAIQTALGARHFHHAPDDLRAERAFSGFPRFVDGAKYWSGRDTRSLSPAVHRYLYPGWDWHRPHVAALSHEIGDDPVVLALLQLIYRDRGKFRSAEPAPKENGDYGVVALAAQ